MEKDKKLKCDWCGVEIEEDADFYTTKKGEIVCEGCFETAWEEKSTLIVFKPDGTHEEVIFTEDFGTLEGDDYPYPVKKVKWVTTDGWRGYTDWELEDTVKVIADGWVTGYPDETTQRKVELHDFFQKLFKGLIIPPTTIYWLFGRTSNIFSTAIKIAVPKSDVELIDGWLKLIVGGIKGLQKLAW